MHVIVDLDKCQGYANCVTDAPEVFDISDETNKCVVLIEYPGEDLRGKVTEAMLNCPVQAIEIETTP